MRRPSNSHRWFLERREGGLIELIHPPLAHPPANGLVRIGTEYAQLNAVRFIDN